MDLSEPTRTPTDQQRTRRVGRADGNGQPELGIPEDPGRAAQTRRPGRRLDDPADPQTPPHPTGAGAIHRHHMAAVPAHPKPPACWRSTSSTSTARSRCGGSACEVDGYGLVAGLFAVYQDRAEKYRFRLKASNGQVVATGEGYETKSAAKRAASPCNGQLTAHRWWSKPTADPSLRCRPPTGLGSAADLR